MKLLIRGGWVVDPSQRMNRRADLFAADGTVAAVLLPGGRAPSRPDRVIDAEGAHVAPGFVDLHVHLREPGHTEKEDIASGTAAAAAGGFTSVLCMPNTDPVNDSPAVTRFILERAAKKARCRVFPVGAVTVGSRGGRLAPLAKLRKAGCVAFTDDGRPVSDARLMRRAMEEARRLRVPLIEHCEEPRLSPRPAVHAGATARSFGAPGVPPAGETADLARTLLLAVRTGARVHLQHLSCADSVELLRAFKGRARGITAEVTPHHLILTEEALFRLGTNAKMYPPLRSARDQKGLREGLGDGTIDAVATDHAPHTAEEKGRPFADAPDGVIGLETALAVLLPLVASGELTLERLVDALSTRPAKIAGLPGGTLRRGFPADIVVFSAADSRRIAEEDLVSKSRNTPFLGSPGKGRVLYTLVGGREVFPAWDR